jgi:hypothetical protein
VVGSPVEGAAHAPRVEVVIVTVGDVDRRSGRADA